MSPTINFTVSAPGKVILFGEHSVVYKKAAVSTSISRRLFVHLNSENGEVVLLKLPHLGSEFAFDLKKINVIVKKECPLLPPGEGFTILKPDLIDHTMYIHSLQDQLEYLGFSLQELPKKTLNAYLAFLYVIRGMCYSVNCDLMPFTLEIKSELEVGTGVGSSAAFAVAISAAVLRYIELLETGGAINTLLQPSLIIKDNITATPGNNSSGFSLNELRIINKWAFCIEKIMHGRPSGIDNTTCTFGSVVKASQENNSACELTFHVSENVPKISLLLISTGVSRNTANLVAKVRTLREKSSSAVDAILNAMDVIAKEAFKTLDDLGTTKDTELYHSLGKLMELNHGLLRTLGVSHESLEAIVSACEQHGLASKLTGAGGGGYAIALIPPRLPRENLEDLRNKLGGLGYEVTEISIAEQGVRLEK